MNFGLYSLTPLHFISFAHFSKIRGLQESFDVFLSHDWGNDVEGRNNHRRARALKDALVAQNIKVWFDDVNMDHRNISQAMSSGIAKSKVGLVLCRWIVFNTKLKETLWFVLFFKCFFF